MRLGTFCMCDNATSLFASLDRMIVHRKDKEGHPADDSNCYTRDNCDATEDCFVCHTPHISCSSENHRRKKKSIISAYHNIL